MNGWPQVDPDPPGDYHCCFYPLQCQLGEPHYALGN